MTAPGAGAGNRAAATAIVKSVMPALHNALNAYPVGSKEYRAVIRAISALSPVFGSVQQQNLVPAAVQQMALAARGGGPVASAPAPGIQPAA